MELNLACMYRPGDLQISENHNCFKELIAASNNLKNLLIFGDFNYPDIKWNNIAASDRTTQSALFINTIIASNLIQLVNTNTRFRIHNNPSCLDLILTNHESLINTLTYQPPIGISDHATILARSQVSCDNFTNSNKRIKNFYSADYTAINRYMESINIPKANTEIRWKCLIRHIKDSLQYVPEVTKKCLNHKPWINLQIKKNINRKRKLWHKYRDTRNNSDFLNYKLCANALSTQIKSAKASYEHNLVDSKSNKQFYKHIKNSLVSKVKTFSLRDPNNEIVSNADRVANLFAHEFSETFNVEPDGDLPLLSDHIKNLRSIGTITFTEQRVARAINRIKDDSSPGPDNIHPLYLKRCQSSLVPHLVEMMKTSLAEGRVPLDWKKSIVIPVFKNGDKLNPANYRQISLTSLLCKCMERIITEDLTTFFIESGILHPQQHGFLNGRSTVSNLLLCVDSWSKDLDRNNPVDVIYLDFKKAFDRVPHKRLILKLKHFGVVDPLLSWISDLLTDRCCQVRIDDQLSDNFTASSGVPQGSVIGPLLFNAFISDLVYEFKSTVSFFADDTKFFGNPLTNRLDLENDLFRLQQWCSKWLLQLNEQKCSVMHMGHLNPGVQYFLNDMPVTPVNQQKDLGVIVSSDLKWEAHIAKIIRKANTVSYLVSISFKNISPQLLEKIYKIYIRPILEYAAPVWNPNLAKDIHALELTQRRITKLSPAIRDLPYEQRLQVLGISPLSKRRLRGDLIETYKILHGHYSVDIIIFELSENVWLRGHQYKLVRERFYKMCRQFFLVNRIFTDWNALPEPVVCATSVNAFKNALDGLNF